MLVRREGEEASEKSVCRSGQGRSDIDRRPAGDTSIDHAPKYPSCVSLNYSALCRIAPAISIIISPRRRAASLRALISCRVVHCVLYASSPAIFLRYAFVETYTRSFLADVFNSRCGMPICSINGDFK